MPDPNGMGDPERKRLAAAALAYMDIVPGRPIEGVPIDIVCNGFCTNGRLSDLRALVDPGSTAVRREAEAERLDRVFREAGFEWRAAGCSMCVSINEDVAPPGARCIATSNRNFENRQGPGSRTHLVSPAMVAAAPVSGTIADVRKVLG